MVRDSLHLSAMVAALLLANGSWGWAQSGPLQRLGAGGCGAEAAGCGCTDRVVKGTCCNCRACRPRDVLRELFVQLDDALRDILPCSRCRGSCTACCAKASGCETKVTCGCEFKSEVAQPPLPPLPPGRSPLLEENPFRDDMSPPDRLKPLARPTSSRVAQRSAADAPPKVRREPRPLGPSILNAVPLRQAVPEPQSVLRKTDRTASVPRPPTKTARALHMTPVAVSRADYFTSDDEPLVRPVSPMVARTLESAATR